MSGCELLNGIAMVIHYRGILQRETMEVKETNSERYIQNTSNRAIERINLAYVCNMQQRTTLGHQDHFPIRSH